MSVLFWFLYKLPVSVLLMAAGVVLCCTLILVPIGTALVDSAIEVLF